MPGLFDQFVVPQGPAGASLPQQSPFPIAPNPPAALLPSPTQQLVPQSQPAAPSPIAQQAPNPEENLGAWQRFVKKLQDTPGAARGLIAFGATMMQPGDAGANFGKGIAAFSDMLETGRLEAKEDTRLIKTENLAERRVVVSEETQKTNQQRADQAKTLLESTLEQMKAEITGLRKDLGFADANQAANIALTEAQTKGIGDRDTLANFNAGVVEANVDDQIATRMRTSVQRDLDRALREQELNLLNEAKASQLQFRQENSVMNMVGGWVERDRANFQQSNIPAYIAQAQEIIKGAGGKSGSGIGKFTQAAIDAYKEPSTRQSVIDQLRTRFKDNSEFEKQLAELKKQAGL